MAVTLVQDAKRVGRVPRNPRHTFKVDLKPFEIQPVVIAPVLPGETMKRMTFQSRVVTKPIVEPLMGWWLEYYFFYVKHRDIVDHADDFVEMALDPDKDMSAFAVGTASPRDYAVVGQPIKA